MARPLRAYQQGVDKVPDITLHRHQGTLKQGFGLNVEQALPANFRAFLRAGWNEGHHESFAYTEMNSTLCVRLRTPRRRVGQKSRPDRERL